MSSSPDRPLQSSEYYLKFMSWDIKKMNEKLDSIQVIGQQLSEMNKTLYDLKIVLSNVSVHSSNETVPF
jgi:hypothetical protein